MKRLIASLVIFQVLLVFVHLAVYKTFVAAFGPFSGMMETVMSMLFIVLAFTFISSTLIARYSRSRLAAAYYTFSAYWFGLVHFLFMGALAFFVTESVFYSFNCYISPAVLGAWAFGIAFFIHAYGTWQSGRGEIVKISVALPHLPEAWRGRTVAFISDVHLGDVRAARFSAMIAHKVSALKPYALFIGGDLFDGPLCDEKKLIAPLGALAQELQGGAWFVTGNHEYYTGDPSRVLTAIRGAGINVLANESVDLEGLQLVGVDDLSTHNAEEFKKVLERIPIDPEKPSVLLKHIPLNIDIAAAKGISLELCGHTHHGQIFPLSLITKRSFKGYDYGLVPHGVMQVYTSSGVGTWGPPLRLGTKSEIVLIEFECSK